MQPSPRLDGAALRTSENSPRGPASARRPWDASNAPLTTARPPTLVRLCRALDVRIEQLLHA
jgi:hypothetical protein